MAMNIYQKTKLIMLKSGKCTAIYNKLAKILIESNDQNLNSLVEQMRELLKSGRLLIGSESREKYYKLNSEITAYCDSKIEIKVDLRTQLQNLINEYKDYSPDKYCNDSYNNGYEAAIESVIEDLENLLK